MNIREYMVVYPCLTNQNKIKGLQRLMIKYLVEDYLQGFMLPPIANGVIFMIKTLVNEHTYVKTRRNKNVTFTQMVEKLTRRLLSIFRDEIK